jgi:hypothetical protein
MLELIAALFFAVLLNYVPRLGKLFKGFNTLIHESGHAFASMLFAGEVIAIDLFYSGEGTATTKSKSWFSRFVISIIGYPFSSLISFLCCYFILKNWDEYILYFLMSLALINLFFWVRNVYGIIWLLVIITGLTLLFYFKVEWLQHYLALGITALIVVDAYVSAWHILIISIRNPSQSGDAKNLQQLAWLPPFFWAFLFFLQANAFLLLSIHLFHPLPFLSTIQNSLMSLL